MIYRFLCQNGPKSECSEIFHVDILCLIVIFFFRVVYVAVFELKSFFQKYHTEDRISRFKNCSEIFHVIIKGNSRDASDIFFSV